MLKERTLKGAFFVLLVTVCIVVFRYMVVATNDNEDMESYSIPFKRRYSASQVIPDASLNECLKHKVITLSFAQLMDDLDIEAVLIEPSVLFCLMLPRKKAQLQEKAFNITEYPQSETITRFALIGKNVEELGKLKTDVFLPPHGFRYEGVIDHSDIDNNSITHHFFERAGEIIHAVTLRERGNYLWLKKIPYIPNFSNFSIKDFLFYKHDTAYERFPKQLLHTTGGATLVAPQYPDVFLHQLSSAKFLECDLSRARYLPEEDPRVRNKKMEIGFINALQQLKTHLQPLLTNFFLFSGSLLGWYRQCGMIHYTTDIDFAAWSSDAGDVNYWIDTFRKHRKLTIVRTFGLPEEALELRFHSITEYVDLFFIYKDGNTTWTSGHVPARGCYLRYTYPVFTLCSADLLGHKVLVPCETPQVISTEYGPEWNKPVSNWHFEHSPKNMGTYIQWPKDKLDQIYREL